MAAIKLVTKLIKDVNDFDKILEGSIKKYKAAECKPGMGGEIVSWKKLWQDRQDYVMAGIPVENILAISGGVNAPTELGISAEQLTLYTYEFLEEQFGRDNVLSCIAVHTEKGEEKLKLMPFPCVSLKWPPALPGPLDRFQDKAVHYGTAE